MLKTACLPSLVQVLTYAKPPLINRNLINSMKSLFLFAFIIAGTFIANAQSKVYFPVKTENIPAAKLNFSKHWAYPWYVIKHPNGKFENTLGGNIKKADTAHLYFTANCQTNVMGGYKLRYCFANRNADGIRLKFADCSPGYENEFTVYIAKNTHSFEPKLIYPVLAPENDKTYQVIKSSLRLDGQNDGKAGKLNGYIDTEFTETAAAPKGKQLSVNTISGDILKRK